MVCDLNNTDWSQIITSNVEDSVEKFYQTMNHVMNKYIPKRVAVRRCYPTWFSAVLKILVTSKKAAHLKYKQTESKFDYEMFSNIRDQCDKKTDKCYKEYIRLVEDSLCENPKYFWKYINDLKTSRSSPAKMQLGDKSSSDLEEIVELFR